MRHSVQMLIGVRKCKAHANSSRKLMWLGVSALQRSMSARRKLHRPSESMQNINQAPRAYLARHALDKDAPHLAAELLHPAAEHGQQQDVLQQQAILNGPGQRRLDPLCDVDAPHACRSSSHENAISVTSCIAKTSLKVLVQQPVLKLKELNFPAHIEKCLSHTLAWTNKSGVPMSLLRSGNVSLSTCKCTSQQGPDLHCIEKLCSTWPHSSCEEVQGDHEVVGLRHSPVAVAVEHDPRVVLLPVRKHPGTHDCHDAQYAPWREPHRNGCPNGRHR